MEENNNLEEPKKVNKSNKKLLFIILSIIGILLLIAIILVIVILNTPKEEEKIENKPKQVLSPYRITSNKLENFDLYFLQLENKQENKIYSPLSIKYALEMLSEGADGDTKEQIDGIIGEYKNKNYPNNANMSFANGLFIREDFKDSINSTYVNNLSSKYNAEVIYDSFKTPNTINNWVSNKTFNNIDKLFDDVSNNSFILTNALAIDMEWNKRIQATMETYKDAYSVTYKHEKYSHYVSLINGDSYKTLRFNDSIDAKSVEIGASINNYDIVKTLGEDNIRKTVGDEYQEWLKKGACGNPSEEPDVNTYLDKYIDDLNSNYKKVDTSTDYNFYYDDDINVFAKDLKTYEGTTLQYIGIMPKNESLDSYIKNIDADKITKVINNIKDFKAENFKDGVVTKIDGQIPLFKFDYELQLMDDLKELGIKDVFDINKANLSKISNNSLVIDKAIHKANIEFSNEGIKAAAATGMGGLGAAGCGFEHLYEVPVEEVTLNFDKPYLFIIRDKDSGEVWFIGTVYQPTENN